MSMIGSRTRRQRSVLVLAASALVWVFVPATGVATAHEEHGQTQEDAGPAAVEGEQHSGVGGHLPASSKNVELVGKVDLTDVDGGIADVAAFGDYAYLNAFHPECAGRNPDSQGTGVHVVDIADPANPRKVGFLPAEPNSYVGEGVHVIDFEGRQYLLHNNETCNGNQPVVSGFALWDVTTPAAAVKLGQYGDSTPAAARQTFHTTHSVQGFVWDGKAYAVASDNQDLKDVDIFDLTPAIRGAGPAVLVSERGIEDWPGAQGSYANGDSVFNHDIQQKVIRGNNMLAVSYWDAGQVLLNINDPANPVYVGDSDFSSPDPQFPAFQIPEGNSHQSYWDQDGDFLLSSDEDFSPTRTLCRITSGGNAGDTGCGEFGFTPKLADDYPQGFEGQAVWGGSGCIEDLNGNGISDRAEVPAASDPTDVVVFSRGGCFFSDKIRSGEEMGYELVAVGQSHGGTRNGLLPDGFLCGSRGSPVLGTAAAVCIGHRAMHQLFDDPPAYAAPEGYAAGGDLPAIGTRGHTLSARGGVFDGWGYVQLHDARDPNLPVIDTYAVAESKDPAHATGSGNLTVHEVKTDMRAGKDLAYLSYYDAGLRVLSFGPGGMTEVGHYIAEGGNDFWGVFPVPPGNVSGSKGRGADKARPLLLMSDRDSGLWILRYTGKE
jgi:hypothetical protein